jgi:hypothetical protein
LILRDDGKPSVKYLFRGTDCGERLDYCPAPGALMLYAEDAA